MAPNTQTTANKNIAPCKPNESVIKGNNLTIINVVIHIKFMQSVCPKSFNFSGITSEMTRNGSVNMANDAIKMTNEKLAIGTQLNDSTLYPHVFNIVYAPNVASPSAVPIVDTTYKN